MNINTEFRFYIKHYIIVLIFLLGVTFIINYFVDPFWYYKGNVITQKNYIFNERLSKVNRILKNSDDYNCIIFGSSTAAMLNEKNINDYKCYNMGFSSATIEEIITYANYVRAIGINPELVILGVDQYNFIDNDIKNSVPDFVNSFEHPPNPVKSYLSYSALTMSIRTLFDLRPWKGTDPRYYNSDFTITIFSDAPEYHSDKTKIRTGFYSKNEVKKIEAYLEFFSIFKDAKKQYFVPPVIVHDIKLQNEIGILEHVLNSVYELSGHNVELIDFSIPSNITNDASRTYDGFHYDKPTNELIVKTFNGNNMDFGIIVNNLSLQEYKSKYLSKLSYYFPESEVSSD